MRKRRQKLQSEFADPFATYFLKREGPYSCATRSHSSRPICALAAIPSSFFRSIEKIRHHRVARAASAFIVVEGDHLRHPRPAEIHGAVILIAVRMLHDDLILVPVKRLWNI